MARRLVLAELLSLRKDRQEPSMDCLDRLIHQGPTEIAALLEEVKRLRKMMGETG
jgi:hypothetical protein